MDLNKLESKLDDALSKETTESLTNWLNNKRMEKKQTAVDSLLDIVIGEDAQGNDYYVEDALLDTEVYNIKQLNKEQMKFMFDCGRNFQLTGEGTFEQVYNETFKPE